MKAPYFSIIIPAHNEQDHIKEALKSIEAQGDKDLEIIVVLDNCTDKTKEIVTDYSIYDSSLNIKIIEASKGSAAGARNLGALRATGKYLFFHDADCIQDGALLNNAKCWLEHYNVEGIATRTTNVPPTNWIQRATAVQRSLRWENKYKLPIVKYLDQNSGINVAIMKRDIFNVLGGFNEKIFYFEDNDLSRRFYESGAKAVFAYDVIQYHHDPAGFWENMHQCRSIAKGMRIRIKNGDELKVSEFLAMWAVPFNLLTGIPAALIFLDYAIKSKDLWGSFLFSILWTFRSAAKLYYFETIRI